MQRQMKVVLAVVAVIVIAVVVVQLIRKSDIGGPKEPEWYSDQPQEKIDCETMQLMTKTWSEWKSLGHQDGKFKNPETGKYTMVSTMMDPATGKKIPAPVRGPASSPQEATPKNLNPL